MKEAPSRARGPSNSLGRSGMPRKMADRVPDSIRAHAFQDRGTEGLLQGQQGLELPGGSWLVDVQWNPVPDISGTFSCDADVWSRSIVGELLDLSTALPDLPLP